MWSLLWLSSTGLALLGTLGIQSVHMVFNFGWIFPKKCVCFQIFDHMVIIRKFSKRRFFIISHSFYIILRGAQIISFHFSFVHLFASVIRFFTAKVIAIPHLHTFTHYYLCESAFEWKIIYFFRLTMKWRCTPTIAGYVFVYQHQRHSRHSYPSSFVAAFK